MGNIRILALDLDDTLLRSDLSVSFRTRNVIKKAAAQGVVVVLASSRVPAVMDRFSRLLGMHKKPGYLICNNGTIVQESHTGNRISETLLNSAAALAVYDLAVAEGFAVQLYEEDVMYVSRDNEYTRYDEKLTGLRQVVVENFRDMIEEGCYKLLIPGDPMLLQPLESIIRTYLGNDITLFASKSYFLEVLPKGTDKGTALALIAEKLGIGREAVLAIGDSLNDEAMIRWAGMGVAMVNGDDRIKNIASLVTEKSNDDDGVAEVIEKYVLGREIVA
jgi:Cof subfamily protein (haloacid dehalogenase superfamily)